MATLTGNTIASTYTGLLSVTGAVGADTVEAVTDGAGTSTSLSLSQQRATITLGSGAADDFIVDGTTFVVEGDNNRVGIGTASPSTTLDVNGAVNMASTLTMGGDLTVNGGDVTISNSAGHANLNIDAHSNEASDSAIAFRSGTTERGYIYYDHNTTAASQKMVFNVGDNAVVAMSILGDGKIGIGTTSPSYRLHVAEDKANDYAAYIINDNADGSGLRLRCDDSDGDEYLFYAENSTTARFAIKSDGKTGIGTASPGGVLQIDAGLGAPSDLGNFEEYHLILRDSGGNTNDAVGMLFTSSADTYGGSAIVHYDTGAGGKGDLAFYTKQSTSAVAPAEVMRLKSDGVISTAGDFQPGADIQMADGRGISFAADAHATGMSSELLDDYEEGLHTIGITGTSSGSWTLHADHNQAAYTKIGRMVTFTCKYETSSGSGSGSLKISLPFTVAQLGNSGGVAAGSITVNRVGSGNNITSAMTAIAFENTAYLLVQVHNENAASDETYLDASDIDGAFEGQIGITYFTTS